MKLSSIFEPQLVRTPRLQKISLCANGMPVSGPASPAWMRASAALAAALPASAQEGYRLPPQEIVDLVTAAPAPSVPSP